VSKAAYDSNFEIAEPGLDRSAVADVRSAIFSIFFNSRQCPVILTTEADLLIEPSCLSFAALMAAS
jgi:hypothetical protein